MIRMSPAKGIFFAIGATAPSFRPPDHRQIAAARKRKHAARGAPAPASMGVVVVRVGSVAVAVLLPGMDVAGGGRLAGRGAGRGGRRAGGTAAADEKLKAGAVPEWAAPPAEPRDAQRRQRVAVPQREAQVD